MKNQEKKMLTERYQRLTQRKQQGVVLFVALIILIVLSVIGISGSQRSTLEEKMATNLHLKNQSFIASESALASFVNSVNAKGRVEHTNFLTDLRKGDKMEGYCLDGNGHLNHAPGEKAKSCYAYYRLDSVHFKSRLSGKVKGTVNAEMVDNCNVAMCSGYSLGGGGVAGCRIFKAEGTGDVVRTQSKSSLWMYEVTAGCSK